MPLLAALEAVRTQMYSNAAGARDDKNVHNVLVVVLDGVKPTRAEIDAANELKKEGVIIFAVGVAQSVTTEELAEFGTTWYIVKKAEKLNCPRFVERIIKANCDIGKF